MPAPNSWSPLPLEISGRPIRVVILGAGFGGLELSTLLSEEFGSAIDITLIDRSESFVFGYSKLDVLFWREEPAAVHHYFRDIVKPGVTFRQETVQSIDPVTRRVTTDRRIYDADIMVVALGADYDLAATPGLAEGAHEFYSVAGATKARDAVAAFAGGEVVIAVATRHYKCPPAPCEAAFMMRQYLEEKGLRDSTTISIVSPFDIPIPVSRETSDGLLAELHDQGIAFLGRLEIERFHPGAHLIHFRNGESRHYDLALAVPVHRSPVAIASSGLDTSDGWVEVEARTLRTRYSNVYALGDVAAVGVPRAGVFSEGQARIVAAQIVDQIRDRQTATLYEGAGTCYVEVGENNVARVDVNFLGGPNPEARFTAATAQTRDEKAAFGASRAKRWFGS